MKCHFMALEGLSTLRPYMSVIWHWGLKVGKQVAFGGFSCDVKKCNNSVHMRLAFLRRYVLRILVLKVNPLENILCIK